MNRKINKKYKNRRVKIISSDKKAYKEAGIIGLYGTVIRVFNNSYAVEIDNNYNSSSKRGVYWFFINELEFIKEDDIMKDFKYVVIANLENDSLDRDYVYALYDQENAEIESIKERNPDDKIYIVVDAIRNQGKKGLAIIKKIIEKDKCNVGINGQVIGIVNMDGYIARIKEEDRLKELSKKKAAIESELEKEINKRKTVEYYEEMAQKYSDNPRLKELVTELKSLGE